MKTVYEMRGFNVNIIYVDRGFESCRAELAELGLFILQREAFVLSRKE